MKICRICGCEIHAVGHRTVCDSVKCRDIMYQEMLTKQKAYKKRKRMNPTRKKKYKPTELGRVAAEARAHGMTYGYWVALGETK